jgi:hypothetical protein
MGYNAF